MSNASSKDERTVVEPSPAKAAVGWDSVQAILVTVLAFFLGQLLAGLCLALIPMVVGWETQKAIEWFDSTSGQFTFVLLAELFTLSILWWFLRKRRGYMKGLGFSRSPVWLDVAYVFAGFVVYFGMLILATALASQFFNLDVNQKQEIGFNNVFGLSDKLLTMISLVVLPPIVEEIVFRGFLYGGLRTKFGFAASTVVTSLLFALPHLFESGGKGLLWIGAVDTFVLSVVLCYAREKTGALWASIGIHLIKNGLAFITLFVIAID